MRLVAFCEAQGDFRIASDLVDRVLREVGPDWVGDVLDSAPEGIRVWHTDENGREFFDLHKLGVYEEQLSVRVPHGHFDGRPGGHGALMARSVFWIVRTLLKRGDALDAVVLIWDMDDEPQARRDGLTRAGAEARRWATFQIVLGCPNAMREAWVLGGFDPDGDEEESRLTDLRRELGFSPNVDAHLLDSNDENAKRNAKRVLKKLTLGDRDREERCWLLTPLDTLRSRGLSSGLRDYLAGVEEQLVPLTTRPDTTS